MTTCPICSVTVHDSEEYCEACGAELSPTVAAATSTCAACGGEVTPDGYCDTCGTCAPRHRDHFSEQPASWVAAVCDRGLRHTRNEDAVALAADAMPGSRAVLVVCDGVSSSRDSDLASLAAARAARDILKASHPRGLETGPSLVDKVVVRLEAAVDAANEAVLEVTNAKDVAGLDIPPVTNPASCTFVAAVVEQDLLVVGSVGDSRAYWLPDAGAASALTLDDSFAQVQITAGVPRRKAESGPQSHSITRWLGANAPGHKPKTVAMTLAVPGWLLVCSDGLWNYCSAAQDLADLVRQTCSSSPTTAKPLALAVALVNWANAQGGQDNISAALARIEPG